MGKKVMSSLMQATGSGSITGSSKAGKDPGFQADWLARVGIGRVITDDYAQPTVDVRPILGKGYASVMRINAFRSSHHPSVRDHNGNNGIELRKGPPAPKFLDDYLDAIRVLVSSMASREVRSLSNTRLHTIRDLAVAPADSRVAAQVWGKQNLLRKKCLFLPIP